MTMTATGMHARNDRGTFEHLGLSVQRGAEPCEHPGIIATPKRASRISPCSTPFLTAFFAMIERQRTASAQAANRMSRGFGGISAQKQAQV
jgi:hypothetical protein